MTRIETGARSVLEPSLGFNMLCVVLPTLVPFCELVLIGTGRPGGIMIATGGPLGDFVFSMLGWSIILQLPAAFFVALALTIRAQSPKTRSGAKWFLIGYIFPAFCFVFFTMMPRF